MMSKAVDDVRRKTLDHLIDECARAQAAHQNAPKNPVLRDDLAEAEAALLRYWHSVNPTLVRPYYVSDQLIAAQARHGVDRERWPR